MYIISEFDLSMCIEQQFYIIYVYKFFFCRQGSGDDDDDDDTGVSTTRLIGDVRFHNYRMMLA